MWSGADSTYLSAITAAAREYTWHGTLTDANGTTYSYDAEDIVSGSGQISKMVSSASSLDVGTVYTSELTIRLFLSIDRYTLYGGTIDLYCDVDVSGTTYSVPMGTFTIAECTQELSCICITAYDAMASLDDYYVTTDQGQADPYTWISYLLGLTNVSLGTTQADIQAMPNGTELFSFTACDQDLTSLTVREALAYLCTCLCANAYIGRDGALYIQQYGTTVTDDIAANERFSSSLSDYTTNYTAISMVVYEDGTLEYYAEDTDDGLTLEIGVNPFMQWSISTVRERTCMAIIDSLNAVAYEPYSVTMPLRPELDPMDVLTFSGNQASTDIGAITSITYKLNGAMSVSCSGANPRLAGAKSKTDKEISGLISKINENDWYSYYFENVNAYSVSDASTMVASIAVQTINESKLTMMFTVNFKGGAKGRYYLYFYLNGELYKTYHDAFLDGDNVATVHFTFNITSAQINYIYVYMESEGYSTFTIDGTWDSIADYTWDSLADLTWDDLATPGTYSDSIPTLTIPIGYSQLTVFGKGLAATSAWDGVISCSDDLPVMTISVVGDLTDSATLAVDTPNAKSLSDTSGTMNLSVIGTITDSMTLSDSLLYYSPYILTGNEVLTGVTASSGVWYGSGELDDGTEGTLQIGDDIYTANISQVSANDSGGYWQLSFDGGSTWEGYTDSTWSTSTMMTATQMAAITNTDLTAKGSTLQIMCHLEDGCTVKGITIEGGSL